MGVNGTGRLVIVSNRLPATVRVERRGLKVVESTGGLAAGLGPAHARTQGLWFGWPGISKRLPPRQRARIDAALPKHRESAVNLVHYLALRKQDIHRLQLDLAALGLSSLGRCEGHVRDTLLRILAWLSGGRGDAMEAGADEPLDWSRAESILHELSNTFPNDQEIAQALVISDKLVKTHVSNILSKLNLEDRTQLAIYAIKKGLVNPDLST